MRLFLAIFPGQEVLNEIRDILRKTTKIKRNFRWIPFEQMHITLKFFGANISEESLELIQHQLPNILANIPKDIEIEIADIQYGFEGQSHPNIIFLSIYETKELNEATSYIHTSIKAMGLEDVIAKKDRKKILHHITLARSKRSGSNSMVKETRDVLKTIKFNPIKFKLSEIAIIESTLTKIGPSYRKIANYTL